MFSQGLVSFGIFSQGLLSVGLVSQGLFSVGIITVGLASLGLINGVNQFGASTLFSEHKAYKLTLFILMNCILHLIFSPNMLFSENYRALTVIPVTLCLCLYQDFGVLAVITSISCHCNNLVTYNYNNDCHFLVYFMLYIIHYQVIYNFSLR